VFDLEVNVELRGLLTAEASRLLAASKSKTRRRDVSDGWNDATLSDDGLAAMNSTISSWARISVIGQLAPEVRIALLHAIYAEHFYDYITATLPQMGLSLESWPFVLSVAWSSNREGQPPRANSLSRIRNVAASAASKWEASH
jgi:hypothetical protein